MFQLNYVFKSFTDFENGFHGQNNRKPKKRKRQRVCSDSPSTSTKNMIYADLMSESNEFPSEKKKKKPKRVNPDSPKSTVTKEMICGEIGFQNLPLSNKKSK